MRERMILNSIRFSWLVNQCFRLKKEAKATAGSDCFSEDKHLSILTKGHLSVTFSEYELFQETFFNTKYQQNLQQMLSIILSVDYSVNSSMEGLLGIYR